MSSKTPRVMKSDWKGLRGQHAVGNPLMRPPNWTTYYDLGVQLNQKMKPWRTWEEVGDKLGITKQNAYTCGVLALGKLAWHAFRAVKK